MIHATERKWTHAICAPCWDARHPDRPGAGFGDGQCETELCCFCGAPTRDGIYTRRDPSDPDLKCGSFVIDARALAARAEANAAQHPELGTRSLGTVTSLVRVVASSDIDARVTNRLTGGCWCGLRHADAASLIPGHTLTPATGETVSPDVPESRSNRLNTFERIMDELRLRMWASKSSLVDVLRPRLEAVQTDEELLALLRATVRVACPKCRTMIPRGEVCPCLGGN